MTRILAVGDVVGEEAAAWLADRLPAARAKHQIDWIVVNAENCAVTGPSPMNGFGMTSAVLDVLLKGGVDVVTGGNHSWDGPETRAVLAHPRVVRPFNVDSTLGQGHLTVRRGEEHLTVVNMLSPTAALPDMNAPAPQPIWRAWCDYLTNHDLPGLVLVDLHGESLWEKASFATAVDGQVTAVVGTHTHDPTLRSHILPGGTGYIAELGMTGRLGFTGGGFDPRHFAADLRGEDLSDLPPFALSTGPMTAGAVLLDVGADGVKSMQRLEV